MLLDPLIQTILYACFAIYAVVGIALTAMGVIYWGHAGAVSVTATMLLAIGAFMLVLGGLSIYANYKQMWLILVVVEAVNIALFVTLTAAIVVRPHADTHCEGRRAFSCPGRIRTTPARTRATRRSPEAPWRAQRHADKTRGPWRERTIRRPWLALADRNHLRDGLVRSGGRRRAPAVD